MWDLPYMLYRGGTSKGPFFLRTLFPNDPARRNHLLTTLMGSPNVIQVDGIGGAHDLANKVGLVSVSHRPNIDIDYLMCQVHPDKTLVETNIDCGNMLAAAGPFAIEAGLVKTTHPTTTIRIYSENTGTVMESVVQTPNGKITYEGSTRIDGVLGSGAPIKLSFINAVGSATKKLLPTGKVVDDIHGIAVTCVDVSMPLVIVSATSLGKSGYESKADLDHDWEFMQKLESIRREAALRMGLGDVTGQTIPKICLVAPAQDSNHTIASRYFIAPFNHDTHPTFAITGALALSAACIIPGTVANSIANITLAQEKLFEKNISIEHPAGLIEAQAICINHSNPAEIDFPKLSYIRTARPLAKGLVCVPGIPPDYIKKIEALKSALHTHGLHHDSNSGERIGKHSFFAKPEQHADVVRLLNKGLYDDAIQLIEEMKQQSVAAKNKDALHPLMPITV